LAARERGEEREGREREERRGEAERGISTPACPFLSWSSSHQGFLLAEPFGKGLWEERVAGGSRRREGPRSEATQAKDTVFL